MISITDLYHALFGRDHIKDGDVISMSEHGRAGGVSTGQGFKFIDDVNYARKITVSGNYTYIAIALPGTAQSSDSWQVHRIDESVSGNFVTTWADGNVKFDNIATDLTALSYS